MKLPKELHEKQELKIGGDVHRTCTIVGCRKTAIQSLSEKKWKDYLDKAKIKYVENRKKKIYICKDHYKEVKKIKHREEKYYQKKGFLDNSLPFGRK